MGTAPGLSAGLVAERSAGYRRARAGAKTTAGDDVWVKKLLKILRSSNRQKTQTVKDLLDVLVRDE
jgi:hypothetical protein